MVVTLVKSMLAGRHLDTRLPRERALRQRPNRGANATDKLEGLQTAIYHTALNIYVQIFFGFALRM